ncbi:hypothetical protein PVAG01_02395 [Phlyctema vagabunda]|uniref:RNI-like protein n=1 Tax=Phlyctema vagabunda TaxID=108571 RepID=A0ABR4PQN7_9HELO
MLSLPAEVLLLICEILGHQGDFKTLYNCAISGRQLVGPALLWLYQIHNQSKAAGSEGFDPEWANLTYQARVDQQKQAVARWALQWQSIIRSSLGITAYPYCLYIRSLDLGNLSELLEDVIFRESIMDEFFSKDMAAFYKVFENSTKRKTKSGRSYLRLNIPLVVDAVGESITNYISQSAGRHHNSAALEELKGSVSTGAITRWTGRLSRLRSINLWDGASLDHTVARSITEHCYDFQELTIYLCVPSRDRPDEDLASFFSGLRSQSLQALSVMNASTLGQLTLSSLSNHSKSLRVLDLGSLSADAVKNLSLLRDCVVLETLNLTDSEGLVNLEATENDVFLDTIGWLRHCDKLTNLSLSNFVSGPAILKPLCLNDTTRLRSLSVVDYSLVGSQDFHRALSQQTSLESLNLKADAEDAFRDDIDTLISSICQLTNLTYLRLVGTSDYFSTPEIKALASSLKKLEDFHFGGYNVTNEVLDSLAELQHLKTLNITALTSFTSNGLLGYISKLKDTNKGLNIAVLSQALEHDLKETEQKSIRKAIMDKVDGRFEFVLFREAEDDFEGSDSD